MFLLSITIGWHSLSNPLARILRVDTQRIILLSAASQNDLNGSLRSMRGQSARTKGPIGRRRYLLEYTELREGARDVEFDQLHARLLADAGLDW